MMMARRACVTPKAAAKGPHMIPVPSSRPAGTPSHHAILDPNKMEYKKSFVYMQQYTLPA